MGAFFVAFPRVAGIFIERANAKLTREPPRLRNASSPPIILDRVHDSIQRRRRTHGGGGLFLVGVVVAADGLGGALGGDEFLVNLGFVFLHRGGDGGEFCGYFGIGGLVCESLGPVHCQVEMRAAIVDLAYFSCRGFVGGEEFGVGFVESIGEDLGLCIVSGLGEMLEAGL